MNKVNINHLKITSDLISILIKEQFPEYSNLPIKPVDNQGHDNRTFRLGEEMLARMPSYKKYAAKVEIEQKWLPKLAPNISLKIPNPLHIGKASTDYPFNWSIYKWIDGKSLNQVSRHNLDLEEIAQTLANFIKEIHKIDTTNAPEAGEHNFYRGCDLGIYQSQAIDNILTLKDIIDDKRAISIMQTATKSKWSKNPIWIHGDLAIGNILIKDNKINAIIDFGGMAIGDPACDLVLYWNFFEGKSQEIFKSELNLDQNTWNRARGWALWKACFEITSLQDNKSEQYLGWLKILKNILE